MRTDKELNLDDVRVTTVEDNAIIIDSGNLDTWVLYHGEKFVYASEFRYSFANDAEFLEEIQDELDDQIADELEYQSV